MDPKIQTMITGNCHQSSKDKSQTDSITKSISKLNHKKCQQCDTEQASLRMTYGCKQMNKNQYKWAQNAWKVDGRDWA